MTVLMTVRVRLPDCSSPPAGPLMSASRTARVRRADYRVPDQSVCRTAGVHLPNGCDPSEPRAHSHRIRFIKKQLVACRLPPSTPHSDDPARGFELLESDRDGAARQARHPGQMNQRWEAVPFVIRPLSQCGDHQLLHGCHRKRPGPIPCPSAHLRPRSERRRAAQTKDPAAHLDRPKDATVQRRRARSASAESAPWDRPMATT
jgi:hypothetical protein